ncbi:MAG: metalloregulator ArsR/SmtB family transcription factor [bacterium]
MSTDTGHAVAAPGRPALTEEHIAELSEIFAALADPTRVRIIYSIRDEERSVGDIASHLDLSEPSVSQHLRRLRNQRIVRMRREGRFRFYRLDDDHVATLLSVCLDHVHCIPPV